MGISFIIIAAMEIAVTSIDELQRIVDVIQQLIAKEIRIFLLSGDLGAGKTALVKAFCQRVEVPESAASPTFSLVNAYTSPVLGTIYHMDLYRLSREQDLDQIGFEEYIDSGHICFIEWPALGLARIASPYCAILIETGQNNYRTFKITTHDTMDA